MTSPAPQKHELTEYDRVELNRDELTADQGEQLWRRFGSQVRVEFPSPKTNNCWRLTSLGHVGQVCLGDEIQLWLRPKVSISSLFGMLEYAYQLDPRFRDELVACNTLAEMFERLAVILAKRVLDRARRGLYRSYTQHERRLGFVRGRIQLTRQLRQPWEPVVHCRFEEHTDDIEENQILYWTLHTILRSGMCTEQVLPGVRRAFRALRGAVANRPISADQCRGRTYNRLNQDYQPMHALCAFFLDHSGPGHAAGERSMLPFLIDMNSLFERFVAEWLRVHAPHPFRFASHEVVRFGADSRIRFDIDLTLEDRDSGRTIAVLDTKYKAPDSPSTADIAQVVAYAEARRCTDAFIVYPTPLPQAMDICVGDIRVRSATFSLDRSLDDGGAEFLKEVLTEARPELTLLRQQPLGPIRSPQK